ncbi:hypothetical protein [Cellulomonas fimi]|uniref:Uncharacterized protein n=1 Tax=Cellulomonas fimi (strain ATCC 484 / DSM 20113 / JCM 1341 / CCUG 24087 / LMG 16345 / NBRC 15513 / NCIMB 8980 / NCTC 7547 / NRS-133) TaxID=590998 RepID=F4H021_CELFA|nr:hypothetical protein [Cellulomonas fimi]AEE44943.1 hypothetical protein Celf_0803 [Cellulomonas fimi ATCC 484]NNH07234.1 hypothetical protein [Cellulomonas fimi]VEH27752.1 Uncharacterised protein [Cellulomonas fimi]
MRDTDEQGVDRAVEAMCAELAGAPWFQVASATARAHHDVEACAAGPARRVAERRYEALRRLLDARTDDLAARPVYGRSGPTA